MRKIYLINRLRKPKFQMNNENGFSSDSFRSIRNKRLSRSKYNLRKNYSEFKRRYSYLTPKYYCDFWIECGYNYLQYITYNKVSTFKIFGIPNSFLTIVIDNLKESIRYNIKNAKFYLCLGSERSSITYKQIIDTVAKAIIIYKILKDYIVNEELNFKEEINSYNYNIVLQDILEEIKNSSCY